MKQPKFSEIDLVRSICEESFYEFVREFWYSIIQETPVWNWHIKYLCDELQLLAEDVFAKKPKKYDLIINVSPGSTKSTIASVMFPAWTWTRQASARCICGSYAHPLALDLSRKSRDVVTSDRRADNGPGFVDCWPEIKLREDQNTKGYFANTKGGIRYAVGVNGSVTGMHAHFIIVDDPLNPNESTSEVEVKKANRWMDETLSSRKVNKEITPTILIMQRLHQIDPTGERLEKKVPVKHICLPADCTEYEVKPPELSERYIDGLMDPVRLSKKILTEARENLGEYGYASQFGQSPIPRGGGQFKIEHIAIGQPPFGGNGIVRKARFWDFASTDGGGDWTVGGLLGYDEQNRVWILDIIRGQWSPAKRMSVIKQTAENDGRDVIIGIEQEPGSSGKDSVEAAIRMLQGFRVYPVRATGSKSDRAEPLAVQVDGENVSIQRAGWNRELLDEMKYFPNSRHDDQVDAIAGAYNLLTKPVRKAGALF